MIQTQVQQQNCQQSGYFKIKVTPQDLTTDTGVVDYEFQVINDTTNSIIDGIGNALGAQSFSGVIREVTDVP